MEHVAGVLKELRTDAAGLARGAGGPGGAAGEAGEGDAVSALQREIAELAGSVGDTAAHADGEGWGGEDCTSCGLDITRQYVYTIVFGIKRMGSTCTF